MQHLSIFAPSLSNFTFDVSLIILILSFSFNNYNTMKLPDVMHAMVLEKQGEALKEKLMPLPRPLSTQVLLKVIACGICRTDLHILDGELTNPKLPLIPGHEIIGRVVSRGDEV